MNSTEFQIWLKVEYIKLIASGIENVLKANKNSRKQSDLHSQDQTDHRDSKIKKVYYNCWLCKGDHKIFKCNKGKDTRIDMRPALTKQDKLLQKTSSGIKQIKTYAFLDRSSNTKLLSKEIGPYLEVNGEIENLNINYAFSKT